MLLGREHLTSILCPFANTAANGRDGPEPTEACLVFVQRLPDPDRLALLDLLPDEWGERVKLIFAECVCDGTGVCPTPQLLADTFARFDLATTEKVHRAACSANEIPYMEFPRERA